MTRQKHLKTLVRARMARTGEAYTTALRHVTALAPATPPAGVVPGYPGFGGGRHHDSTLLTHVLAAAGITAAHDGAPLDEPMVAGLAGGIGFMYFSFAYSGRLPTMTIVPQIHPRPFVLGALERAGIAHRVAETTSAAKAARELDAVLDAGRAPLVTLDRGALPHQVWADRVPGSDPYDVVVAGRRGDVVLVDDERLDPVELSADVLASARAAHRKSRHRLVVVEHPGGPVDLGPAVRAAVAVTVHDLTEDVVPGNFAGNFGLRGLAKWVDALGDRRSRTGWTRTFDSGPAFGYALRRLYDCLTSDHASPGAMRALYAEFLTAAAGVLDAPAAREAAVLYDRAATLWTRIADTAVSGSLAPYRGLVERRLELLLGGGGTAELADLAREAESLTAGLEVSADDRQAELDALAEVAAQVLPLEREACTLLARVAAG
ncbi:hypothetical protein GCM10027451_03460 [Geodermatophilus aquaeductus]|uniref:Butirosin biosynthesis protein H, N-terminal n=1 Tax=Geodermatophilus aquaeductus TaxID=1564161 RepID=A0A521CFS3_9ACTN|nr:BtrH N-terminal domain-containing protein [Geodermatophilus aquaeductus]SMO57610.1 Butirosin biosynthesis protein H, N-terminal [Geodermatophilus aquaeductus]